VLNVTPDSFSDAGVNLVPEAAVAAARRMLDEGAAIVDVGGESTRPGASAVPLDEELRRVVPVLEALEGAPLAAQGQRLAILAVWGVVSFFIRMRMSPSRSLLRLRVWISSWRRCGACFQNSCLYFSLASQKQRKQNGHSFVGFLGSSEHQTAFKASNSPRQFQHVVR